MLWEDTGGGRGGHGTYFTHRTWSAQDPGDLLMVVSLRTTDCKRRGSSRGAERHHLVRLHLGAAHLARCDLCIGGRLQVGVLHL